MFVATLYDLDFEVTWIDLLALLEMLAFYQCGHILKNYIMPAFFRFVNGTVLKLILREISVHYHYMLKKIKLSPRGTTTVS